MSRWKSIVQELHRRSVWQVLGIYLAAAWGTLQFVDFIVEVVGLPTWVTPFALVLCAIGLPIVLATAVVQEGHPLRDRVAEDPTLLPDLEPAMAYAQDSTPSTAARWLTWRRALLGGALAFTGLAVTTGGYMGMRALGIGPAGTLFAAGVLDASDRVILADFEAAGTDATTADVITEALRIDLLQSRDLGLVDAAEVQQVMTRMQQEAGTRLTAELAREAARREGYKVVLAGEVGRIGTGHILNARLLIAETGETVAAFRQTAAGDADLLKAVDALSRSIRAKVGESLRTVNASQKLEHVTTSSFEALVLYSTAERIASGREPADGRSSIRLMQEAVQLDSTFAMAWRKLGAWLYNAQSLTEAYDALRTAYRHRERLPELERRLAEGLYFQVVAADEVRAAEAHQRVLDINPNDKSALNNLTYGLAALGRYEEGAERGLRGIAQPYPYMSTFGNLIAPLVALGRWDEAQMVADSIRALAPMNLFTARADINIAAARLEFVRADSLATWMYESGAPVSRRAYDALRSRSAIRATQGRLQLAEADIARIERDGRDIDAQYLLLESALASARVIAEARGDQHASAERLRHALNTYAVDAMPAQDAPLLELAAASAVLGDIGSAQQWLARADARRAPEAVRKEQEYHTTEALIAIQQQRYEDAVRTLQRVGRQYACTPCVAIPLARAWEGLQQADSAAAQYRHYITTPRSGRQFTDAQYLAHAYFRLAELLEAQGDRAGAIENYGHFVNLWRNADPELQPRVRAAEQRIAALRGQG